MKLILCIFRRIPKKNNPIRCIIFQMHCEGGGQIVLAIGDTHCLSAADNLTLVKETVFAIAGKHSLHATFAPKL